jgi:hypothetical protein
VYENRRSKNGSYCRKSRALVSYLHCYVGRVGKPDESLWPISVRAAPYDKIGEERKPTIDCAYRWAIVRLQRGRNVASFLTLPPLRIPKKSYWQRRSGEVELRTDGLRIGGLLGRGARG